MLTIKIIGDSKCLRGAQAGLLKRTLETFSIEKHTKNLS